ncbi:MAG: hypothetical protein IJT31_03350, partial [Oscillibacter sp.]|nr:hypothetical protein [Oscillibacter sp.]
LDGNGLFNVALSDETGDAIEGVVSNGLHAALAANAGTSTATAGSGATASVSAGQRGSGTVSVAGLSAAELNSASISVGGASNNGGTSSLPNTGVDDDRALYALLFAFSALCACGSLRLARRKYA